MKRFFRVVWKLSTWTGIPLGPLAPWVVGGMIGRWPRRKRHILGVDLARPGAREGTVLPSRETFRMP